MIQGKQVSDGEVQVVHFEVTGEFITEHARDRMRPGDLGWQSALKFLTDSISGLSTDEAIEILKGEMCLAGSSADPQGVLYAPEIHRDEIRAEQAERWGGIVRESGRHWEPYASVRQYLGADEDFNRNRCYHYANSPDDKIVRCDLDEGRGGRFVLFKRCDPPPIWVKPLTDWSEAAWRRPVTEIEVDPEYESTAAADFMRWQQGAEDDAPVGISGVIRSTGISPEAAESMEDVLMGRADTSKPVAVEPGDDDGCGGYITRDGKFYPCGYMQHPALASRLFKAAGQEEPDDPQQAADEAGWLRVQKEAVGTGWNSSIDRRPSSAQRRTWEDWCMFHHVDPDSLVEPGDRGRIR